MHTSLGSFIYAMYILKYTQTACLAGWENRNTSWEGHEGKNHKEKQELFTFNNSVAFNISIYIHTLSIYVQTAMGSEWSLFQTQKKNTKPLNNSLDKCLQVAELSSFTKKILYTDETTSIFGELKVLTRCLCSQWTIQQSEKNKLKTCCAEGGFSGL